MINKEELEKLFELKQKGIITEKEFELKKKELLLDNGSVYYTSTSNLSRPSEELYQPSTNNYLEPANTSKKWIFGLVGLLCCWVPALGLVFSILGLTSGRKKGLSITGIVFSAIFNAAWLFIFFGASGFFGI